MIKREAVIFLVVGSLTVLVDFSVYRTLIRLALLSADISKMIGFLSGTLFAYFANRFWTFGQTSHEKGSLLRFVVVYGATLVVNVVVNSAALKLLSEISAVVQVAFILATLISASINFLGMKLFVFKPRSSEVHT